MGPLNQITDHLPNPPGVYLLKDKEGTILYIGEAIIRAFAMNKPVVIDVVNDVNVLARRVSH